MTALDDAALVVAARTGDHAAFSELLQRHRPLLLTLCRRLLPSLEIAEDIAQEAALEAFLDLDRLRRPESFGSWLAGIGLHLCHGWLRATARENRSNSLGDDTVVQEFPDEAPTPEHQAELRELAERVRAAVADLPAGRRSAVMLVYLAGFRNREAAAILGIKPGALRVRLHQARATLRSRLAVLWEERMSLTNSTNDTVDMRVVDVREPRGQTKPGSSRRLVLLEDRSGARRMVIGVSHFEGDAIALLLEGVEVARPRTHELMSELLRAGALEIAEVRIERIDEATGTIFGIVVLEGPEGRREVDARPSDALALALVTGAPIRATEAALTAGQKRFERIRLDQTRGAGEFLSELLSPAHQQSRLRRWRSTPT